jgi:hypothetical protein
VEKLVTVQVPGPERIKEVQVQVTGNEVPNTTKKCSFCFLVFGSNEVANTKKASTLFSAVTLHSKLDRTLTSQNI